jgi:hypothetical protein
MTRFALPLFAALFGCALVPSALAQTLQDRFPGADEMKPGPPPVSDQAPAKPAKPARPAKAAAKPAAAAGDQDKPVRAAATAPTGQTVACSGSFESRGTSVCARGTSKAIPNTCYAEWQI